MCLGRGKTDVNRACKLPRDLIWSSAIDLVGRPMVRFAPWERGGLEEGGRSREPRVPSTIPFVRSSAMLNGIASWEIIPGSRFQGLGKPRAVLVESPNRRPSEGWDLG